MTNIYQTVYNTHQALSKALADRLKPLGITGHQFTVLAAVMRLELDCIPGPSQSQLVDATGIDRSTMADIVRRLSTKALVQVARDQEDARACNVSLTRKGRDVTRRASAAASALETFIALDRPTAIDGLEKRLLAVIEAARGTDGSVRSLVAAE